jgi:hypothetical protein
MSHTRLIRTLYITSTFAALCLAAPAQAYKCDKPLPSYETLFNASAWVAQVQVLEGKKFFQAPTGDEEGYADVMVMPVHFYKGKLADVLPSDARHTSAKFLAFSASMGLGPEVMNAAPARVRFDHEPKLGALYHVFVQPVRVHPVYESDQSRPLHVAADPCWNGVMPLIGALPKVAAGNAFLAKRFGTAPRPDLKPALYGTGTAGLVISFGGKNDYKTQQKVRTIFSEIRAVLPNGEQAQRFLMPPTFTKNSGWSIHLNDLPAGLYSVNATLPNKQFGALSESNQRWRYSHEKVVARKDNNGGNCGINPELNTVGANRVCDDTHYFIELVSGETRSAALKLKL